MVLRGMKCLCTHLVTVGVVEVTLGCVAMSCDMMTSVPSKGSMGVPQRDVGISN